MKGSAPTLKEIAKMLNLSVTTVSRALHDSAGISAATINRVKEVASELGYEPNQTAVFLKAGKTFTIGVILPHLSEVFFSEAISGIEDYASEHKYNVLMGQSHDNVEREKEIVEAMKNHRVDGLLVSIAKNTRDLSHFNRLVKYKIPVVFFDRTPNGSLMNSVTCRLDVGMREVFNFLIERGHTEIGFLNGPKDLFASIERMEGYKTSMKFHKIKFNPKFVVHSDLTPQSTCYAMQQLLTLRPMPTAVIAFNDYVALEAMKYARKMNVRINQDISFVSFANLPMCTFMENPPLASIEQFPYHQGQRATEMLLEILNSGRNANANAKFKKIVLEPRLVVHS